MQYKRKSRAAVCVGESEEVIGRYTQEIDTESEEATVSDKVEVEKPEVAAEGESSDEEELEKLYESADDSDYCSDYQEEEENMDKIIKFANQI